MYTEKLETHLLDPSEPISECFVPKPLRSCLKRHFIYPRFRLFQESHSLLRDLCTVSNQLVASGKAKR